jgi:hypothetical protein
MWRCVSTIPGIRIPPAASISTASSGAGNAWQIAAMRSPATRRSAFSRTPALSIVRIVALRKTIGRPGANSGAGESTGMRRPQVVISG